jgi:hypothetical protein
MNDAELQDLLKRAGEISKVVPEGLREAAFNRAFDVLTGAISPLAREKPETAGAKIERSQKKAANGPDKASDYLLAHLDRTSYPQVSSANRVLDRALHLLRIARDDFDIDGLGAPDIARVLTEKFRLRVSRQAVQQSLDAARNHVDKLSGHGRKAYRIMDPGERYLDSLGVTGTTPVESMRSAASGRRAAKRSMRKPGAGESEEGVKKSKKTSSNRPGPRASLNELFADGYFDAPRRIAEIQQHLEHSKARSYKLGDLSPTLVRMLRQGVLVRNRAEDGQYEYIRK